MLAFGMILTAEASARPQPAAPGEPPIQQVLRSSDRTDPFPDGKEPGANSGGRGQ